MTANDLLKEHTADFSSALPKSDPKPITESPLYYLLKQQFCQECDTPVSATERYICPGCGKILCQFCRKEHECQIPLHKTTSPQKHHSKYQETPYIPDYIPTQHYTIPTFDKPDHKTTPTPQPAPTLSPSKGIEETVKCVASEVAAMRAAQEIKEKPISKPVQPLPPKSEPVPITKYLWCDGCGRAYPESSLRRCGKCGKIYCKHCQTKHHCSSLRLPKITWSKRSQKTESIYESDYETGSSRSKARSSRPVLKAVGQFLWGFFRIPLTLLLILGVVVLGIAVLSPSSFDTPSVPTTSADVYPHITYDTSSYISTTIEHDFTYQNYPLRISLTTNRQIYNAARNPESKKSYIYSGVSNHQWNTNYYRAFIDDESQQTLISQLSQELQGIRESYQLDTDEYIELVTAYVQSIPYHTGNNDPKFPIETLIDYNGDCDDKSILLAALLADAGYGVALLEFPEDDHMAVGIAVEPQYAYKGTGHYAIIETTDYWLVSEVPDVVTSIPAVIPIGGGTKTYTAAYQVNHIMQKWRLAYQRIQTLRYATSESDIREYNRAVDYYNLLTGLDSSPNRDYIYQKMSGYY